MAIYIIPKRYQRAWSVWNLRVAVLYSLCLQILLIFLSPFRKSTRRMWPNAIIWLCYLMADWIAAYSVGVIVNHSSGDDSCEDGKCVDPDLAAFWSPFLLLHLGGPDTITAFSLEDNELWMRHLFSLMVEVVVVLYVLLLAIPSNALWLPFLLVFVAGTIKYAERTRALYLACLGNIKDWSSRSRVEYRIKKETVIERDGYAFYKISRKLIPGLLLTVDDFKKSSTFFRGLEPNYAFNVMAVELSFMYDELFTKMATVHRGGLLSCFSRLTCNVLIVVAFVIFSTTKKLKVSHNVDITLTYALLIGAIFLDFIALIKFVFSDWMMACLKDHHPKASEMIYSIYKSMNCFNFRWSESISQHNFIGYCMIKNRPHRPCSETWFDGIIDYFGLTTTFKELRYKDDRNVSEGLKEFIYNWLKELDFGGSVDERNYIVSSLGKRTLVRYDVRSQVVNSSVKIDYERSLFFWHIATDLLYFTLDSQEEAEAGNINHREICKILSDYMFYLYIMRPSLISTHQGGAFQRRFDRAYEDVMEVVKSEELSEQRDVCEKLLSSHTEEDLLHKGEIPGRVLRDACTIARHLKGITQDKKKMWEILSQVLLEMLCYGAYRSRGAAHAQHLSRGGELITFVWLLMAHFGLTESQMTVA